MNQRPRPGRCSPKPGNRPKGALNGAPFFMGTVHGASAEHQPETRGKPAGTTRPAEAEASDHRHRGAGCSLQLAGQLKGPGHRHEAQLADGLAAAAEVDGVALVAVGLDAIRVDVHHQSPDLAAEGGADRHR
jgi:hypothetical protein